MRTVLSGRNDRIAGIVLAGIIFIFLLWNTLATCSALAAPGEEAVILTPKPPETPRINGPRVFGVRPGHPFLFTIPATGKRPMEYAVDGLPEGLTVDPQTGQITGAIKSRGEYVVTFRAKNALGQAERKFKIVCGDTLALTPPMGWNSWYIWVNGVSDKVMRQAADAIVSTGMIDHGYAYVNIDDCWMVKPGTPGQQPRDAQGNVNPNERFPDMKAMTDYIHAKGLKAGLYTSPGPLTCGGYVGAYQHEEQDARRFAEWGFDFLKYDWCSYGHIANGGDPAAKNIKPWGQEGPSLEAMQRPYRLMCGLLKKQDRDIVMNYCQYGMGDVWKWGREAGGQSRRIAGDFGADYDGASSALGGVFNLYGRNELQKYNGPGAWNDPDYVLIGYLHNWKTGKSEPTRLTPNEQYSHVSLWCLEAAPLIFSGDMQRLDDFTLSLLTNDEVIEVDQDPLGKAALRVAKAGDLEVWAKEMEDGSKAVGLFNRGPRETQVTAKWSDVGVTGKQIVRDLWRQKDLGTFEGQFSAPVGRHGVVFVRLRPAPTDISHSANLSHHASTAADREAVILTPKPPETPRINGAKVFGVRPGHPFLFTIPATGRRPMEFAVDGLPEGLKVDPQTGQLTGSIARPGTYEVTFHAKNSLGEAQRKFKIVCGDTLALTPHMGWNSWYIWDGNVTDKHMRDAADAMVSTGLINHGYSYVNIDDCWAVKPGQKGPLLGGPARDAQGNIKTNKRFPDMKALTDYIHGKGLKAGIYTSPGPLTCCACEGAYKHEEQDARQFAQWGFDFLKYDWCSYGSIAGPNPDLAAMQKPYRQMGGILKKLDRDIVLNFCQYGMGSSVWKWGPEAGGQSWRTAGDFGADFEHPYTAMSHDVFDLFGRNEAQKYSGPGAWNDPDYILLGYLTNWKGKVEPTRLTPNEQYSHVSLWCLVAAPLIFSGDITRLDDFTLSLLANDEVIEVDQDPLGKAALRVAKAGDLEVWAKDMEDGSKAVGLFNRGPREAKATVKWSDLGVAGKQIVRDLWRQKDLGTFEGQFSAPVARHGVVLVRLRPAK